MRCQVGHGIEENGLGGFVFKVSNSSNPAFGSAVYHGMASLAQDQGFLFAGESPCKRIVTTCHKRGRSIFSMNNKPLLHFPGHVFAILA